MEITSKTADYSARPLSASREYAGYQFYAKITFDGYSAEAYFLYVALTIQNWLCERITNANAEVPATFQCPPAEAFAGLDTSVLKSASSHIAGIVSIPDEGIWSLWVREPDPQIKGRSFVTHAAVRIVSDTTVDFGVYIDIIDRDIHVEEVEFAFRPKFVRLLFQTKGLHLSQNIPLLFKKYTTLGTKKSIREFMDLTNHPDNMMPLIVFTHAPIKKPSIEEICSRVLSEPTEFLSATSIPELHKFDASKVTVSIPPVDPTHQLPINRQTVRKYGKKNEPASPIPRDALPESDFFLPYDAEEFAKHTYGFGKVFVLKDSLFSELSNKLKHADFHEGDILLIEPCSFGGGVHVYKNKESLSKSAYASVTDSIQELLRGYSKRKPYRFGSLLFEEAAWNRQKELELDVLREQISHSQTETEQKLLNQLAEERNHSAELQRLAADLRAQLTEEYQKGAASQRSKDLALEEKLTSVKQENIDLHDQIDSMQNAFAEAKNLREALHSVRTLERLPQTNSDVVQYFRSIYADCIDFTDQGERTAAKCSIKPEVLWDCLYAMVTDLVEIHRTNPPDVEALFKERTGWEVAMCEGSQTRSNPKLMALRKDSYHGREISIEPHIKFERSEKKTGTSHQRLYYCYDDKTRMIIVGYVGDHLANHLSLSL